MILEFLNGKKTYICAIAGGVVFILARLGAVTPDMELKIYALLGFGAAASLKSAVSNTAK